MSKIVDKCWERIRELNKEERSLLLDLAEVRGERKAYRHLAKLLEASEVETPAKPLSKPKVKYNVAGPGSKHYQVVTDIITTISNCSKSGLYYGEIVTVLKDKYSEMQIRQHLYRELRTEDNASRLTYHGFKKLWGIAQLK